MTQQESSNKLPKRIILLTIDSLRYDEATRMLWPQVSKVLSNHGDVRFFRAFANGPGTPQSFPSILASSSFLLLKENLSVPANMVTLAELFSTIKFKTVAIHSNPFLSRTFGWNKGFQLFKDFSSGVTSPTFNVSKLAYVRYIASKMTRSFPSIAEIIKQGYQRLYSKIISKYPYIPSTLILKLALKIMGELRNEKVFLWVHLMDTHWPYNISLEGAQVCGFRDELQALKFQYRIPISFMNDSSIKVSSEDLKKLKCLYKMSIKQLSIQLKEFLYELADSNLMENAILIILSDHGESFGEHNVIGHPFFSLYNELLTIPLIVFHSDEDIHELIPLPSNESYLQPRDLAPTLLFTYGIKKVPSMLGKALQLKNNQKENLVEPEQRVFSETASIDPFELKIHKNKFAISLISKEYKLIVNTITNKLELFNIKRDYNERCNLIYDEPYIAKELFKHIHRYLKMLEVRSRLYKRMRNLMTKLYKARRVE